MEDRPYNLASASIIQAHGKCSRLNSRGIEYHTQGEDAKAIFLMKAAIRADPDNYVPYFNIAVMLDVQNRFDEAIDYYEKALDLRPNNLLISQNLASLYHHKDSDRALGLYQHILDVDPGNVVAQHFSSAIQGIATATAPISYVECLFDQHADEFENHLLSILNYTTPLDLATMLEKLLPPKRRFRRALDLGCGTGLSGAALGGRFDWLVGIDLSANMLSLAAKKNIYSELCHVGIIEYLSTSALFDFFVAADVFPYCGDLQPVFKGIRGRCLDSAYFIFSTEAHAGDQYYLTNSGRYQHSRCYVEKLLAQSGFNLVSTLATSLRLEAGRQMMGDLYIAVC